MNFEPLLGDPILACRQFDSIASDVGTFPHLRGDVIIRASTVENIKVAPWTWSCHNLFGVDVRHVEDIYFPRWEGMYGENGCPRQGSNRFLWTPGSEQLCV